MRLKEDDVRSLRVVKLAKNLTGRAVAYRTWTTRVKTDGQERMEERISHVYAGRVESVNEEGIAHVRVTVILSDDGASWVKLPKATILRVRADCLIPLNEKKKKP